MARLQQDDGRQSIGKEMTIGAAWEVEKSRMLPLPRFPYRCCVSRPARANRLSLVVFDNHRYSVPVEYGFSRLTLHAYAWQVEIACGDRIIASHRRRYGNEPDALEVEHYLPLLERRTGAFPYAVAVRQWDMPAVYRNFFQALSRNHNGDGVREFIQVLMIGRQCGREIMEQAMSRALAEKRVDSERIRQLITGADAMPANQGIMPDLAQPRVVLPDLGQFDRLRPYAVTAIGGAV